MTEEKKAEEKKAAATDKNDKAAAKKDAPEESDQQKWDREHLELVNKLQEAKAAVVDHRYPSAEAVAAAKSAAETTVKAGAETIKKGVDKVVGKADENVKVDERRAAREEEEKGAPKGPLPKSTEGFEKSSWPK